jgi:hypothetical protein
VDWQWRIDLPTLLLLREGLQDITALSLQLSKQSVLSMTSEPDSDVRTSFAKFGYPGQHLTSLSLGSSHVGDSLPQLLIDALTASPFITLLSLLDIVQSLNFQPLLALTRLQTLRCCRLFESPSDGGDKEDSSLTRDRCSQAACELVRGSLYPALSVGEVADA